MIQHRGIDFEHIGIGIALKRNRLVVPLNQREYSWEEEHVKDLFYDLAQAIDGQKSSYFLGTIVLTRGKDDSLEVADGQQRLATVTILLAAIRDYFQSKRDDILVTSLEEFLFTIVRETREINPRLKLNVDDNEFFRKRILSRENTEERRSVTIQKRSHYLIEQAAKLAKEHVQAIISVHSEDNRTARLNLWVRYIENFANVILLTVADDLNAYVMFETLNDRGLRTSQSDLVKNFLFAKADDRINEAQQKWAIMMGSLESLEKDDPVSLTYLRHLIISLYGHTREREVFERIKQKITSKQQSIDFLETLAICASDYVAISNPMHAKWNQYNPNIREYIKALEPFQLEPMRPLMLAVTRRFPKTQVEKAFRHFIFWTVRFSIAGGWRTGATEEGIAKAAKEVSDGHINTVEQLAVILKDVLPEDVVFENRFAIATVSKNSLARYYLRALELKVAGKPEPEWVPNENTVINLEHILPENPSSEWGIDKGLVSSYFKRIGNMVLIQATVNTTIGNTTFDIKKEVFRQSGYSLTQQVAEKSVWGPLEIEERQKSLAKIAVTTWPMIAP